jgi:hypothetical protein
VASRQQPLERASDEGMHEMPKPSLSKMNVTPMRRYRCDDEVAVRVCNNPEFLGGCLNTDMSERQQCNPGLANLCILPKESVLITDFYHQKYAFMLGFEPNHLFTINTDALISEGLHTCSSSAVYGSPLGPTSVCFFEDRS